MYFFANFAGLEGGVNPVQTPQSRGSGYGGWRGEAGMDSFFRFWARCSRLRGLLETAVMVYKLPAIEKGAVFWVEP